MMISGESGGPPGDLPLPFIGEGRLGDLTVVRQVRNLMLDKSAAAVVLWIDSGGGAAIAADAMTAAPAISACCSAVSASVRYSGPCCCRASVTP
jgi:hypothetical protein